jgi:RNA polymerase-binding transcription factor DksA
MTVDEPQPRALLEGLRAEAAARVAASASALDDLTRDREGSNDDDEHDPEGVTLSSEWSRLTGLADAAAAELRQVDEALARLDAGAYGVCAGCGRPIPAGRLEARPFATHCVSCAERLGR